MCMVIASSDTEHLSMLDKLRQRRIRRSEDEILLVSSPGYAVLDSGCGRTIIGADTLTKFRQLWKLNGLPQPEIEYEENAFKFGNGHREVLYQCVRMPIQLAGKTGAVRAAVVKGDAPLLLSRPSLKSLAATMDFQNDVLHLFEDRIQVPLKINSAGQYVVKVTGHPESVTNSFRLANAMSPTMEMRNSSEMQSASDGSSANQSMPVIAPPDTVFAPSQDESPPEACTSNDRRPHEKTKNCLCAPAQETTPWTSRQHRVLMAQVKEVIARPVHRLGDKLNVIEVFSPPRFALEAATKGLTCLSADLVTGWDFRKPSHRKNIKRLVSEHPPELLVLCPPCTWAGGWFHLNKMHMSEEQVECRRRLTKLFVTLCCELAQMQLDRGGRVLFEHPRGSSVWQFSCMNKLRDRMHQLDLDMCCYGMRVPGGPLIKKATRLWVSHHNMLKLVRRCPGEHHPDHANHQIVAGTISSAVRQTSDASCEGVSQHPCSSGSV